MGLDNGFCRHKGQASEAKNLCYPFIQPKFSVARHLPKSLCKVYFQFNKKQIEKLNFRYIQNLPDVLYLFCHRAALAEKQGSGARNQTDLIYENIKSTEKSERNLKPKWLEQVRPDL